MVNSLFSDGCFAVALISPHQASRAPAPPCYVALHDFGSLTATEALETMIYRWDERHSQFWFELAEDAPYAVGAGMLQLLREQQQRSLPLEHVRHWVVHTGGQTVIDAVAASLGLDLPELEPTVRALKRYGHRTAHGVQSHTVPLPLGALLSP